MTTTADTFTPRVSHEPKPSGVKWATGAAVLVTALIVVIFVVSPGLAKAIGGAIFTFLEHQPFVLLVMTLAGGYALGNVGYKGISMGATAGTLVVALPLSLWANARHSIAFTVPAFVGTLFFNLFMFAVGMKVGPQFLVGLRRGARDIILIGFLIPILAAGFLMGMRALVHLPPGMAVGVFAGANTATPGLGAAQAAYASGAVANPAEAISNMATAFAFGYLVDVVLFVLLLKSLPRLFKRDAVREAREFEREISPDGAALPGTAGAFLNGALPLGLRTFRIEKPEAAGRSIRALRQAYPRLNIEHIVRDGELIPVTDDTSIDIGDEIAVIAPNAVHLQLRDRVGTEVDEPRVPPAKLETVEIVQKRAEVVGMKLEDLAKGVGHGLYLNAMFRAGEHIPHGPNVTIEKGDVLRVTGSPDRIRSIEGRVGSIVRPSLSTDMLTLMLGLTIGGFLGAVTLPLGAIKLSLGAVALLLVGVALSALRTRNPALGGPFPEPARQLFEGLGLNVYLAVLGLNAGPGVMKAVATGALVPVLVGSAVIGLVPPLIAWVVGQYGLKMNIAALLGTVAGARCSSPGMRAAQETAQSTVPAIAYPVAFAISNVLFTIASYAFALTE